MKSSDLPFNIELLKLTPDDLRSLRPVTSLDYFETHNGDLHEEGLFSISIFGRIGDEVRDQRFAYIDMKTQVFHPLIYRSLVQLRNFYSGIMAGTQYARWNEELRDFEPASETAGRTGYSFFVEHWADIVFKINKSPVREQRIKLIDRYKDRALTSRILVLPAGLRDIEIGDDGRTVVPDINALYRRVMTVARAIPNTDFVANDASHDLPRHMLQMAFNAIYDHIELMLTGKSGFFQSKWGSRRIHNGTRNVITAMNVPIAELGAPNVPKFTDTVVGLYQHIKSILPVTIHLLLNGYLAQIFAQGNNQAQLVNPTTLKAETVELPPDLYDRWNTVEGLEKVITSFKEDSIREKPVMVGDHLMALIYAPPHRKVFRVFSDIDELPAAYDRKHVRPINLIELIYLSGYQKWNDYVGVVTRYPVTGIGSTYPTTYYVKTTIRGEMRQELGDDWETQSPEFTALEFPTYSPLAYLNSLVIPSHRLKGLGADFDGDTASDNALYSDEAVAEIKDLLNTKAAYVDPRGGLHASTNVDTFALVLLNLTRPPAEKA